MKKNQFSYFEEESVKLFRRSSLKITVILKVLLVSQLNPENHRRTHSVIYFKDLNKNCHLVRLSP